MYLPVGSKWNSRSTKKATAFHSRSQIRKHKTLSVRVQVSPQKSQKIFFIVVSQKSARLAKGLPIFLLLHNFIFHSFMCPPYLTSFSVVSPKSLAPRGFSFFQGPSLLIVFAASARQTLEGFLTYCPGQEPSRSLAGAFPWPCVRSPVLARIADSPAGPHGQDQHGAQKQDQNIANQSLSFHLSSPRDHLRIRPG